jgi:spermidine synthase
MELWCSEQQTQNLKLSVRIRATLFSGKSEFQEIMVVDSFELGRMLILDGVFQTSTFDEFIYHEMIAHVPLHIHPNPRKVLVIGGGDGGCVREVVKHPNVVSVEMVEIDGLVVEVAKKYLPDISSAMIENNPKLQVQIGDGIGHMKNAENEYDVIIVDCSDPIGPGEGLFTYSFYQNVYKALKPDGLFVQQTESPFYHQPLIKKLHKDIRSLFPITELYLAQIPIYPGGLHSFTIGSKKYNSQSVDQTKILDLPYRYYNRELQTSCFVLPNFIKAIIK